MINCCYRSKQNWLIDVTGQQPNVIGDMLQTFSYSMHAVGYDNIDQIQTELLFECRNCINKGKCQLDIISSEFKNK